MFDRGPDFGLAAMWEPGDPEAAGTGAGLATGLAETLGGRSNLNSSRGSTGMADFPPRAASFESTAGAGAPVWSSWSSRGRVESCVVTEPTALGAGPEALAPGARTNPAAGAEENLLALTGAGLLAVASAPAGPGAWADFGACAAGAGPEATGAMAGEEAEIGAGAGARSSRTSLRSTSTTVPRTEGASAGPLGSACPAKRAPS
jgi:hypothetical protein